MRNGLVMIKLPSDVYYLWSLNVGLSAPSLLLALKGIRSKGSTVVFSSNLMNYGFTFSDMASYLRNKGFKKVDRIFICDDQNFFSTSASRLKSYKKEAGYAFANITKRVLIYDARTWAKTNNITDTQLGWFSDVVYVMANNKKFLLGQLGDRIELERIKENIVEKKAMLEKKEAELKNLKSVEDIGKTSIKNILHMKWIDKLESTRNGGIRILTKQMACTFVPNIGKYLSVNEIKRNDMLYRIMKYQCLGKYFIIQPDYYIIDNNFGIKADSNQVYPFSRVRNVPIQATYFHGQACHIGNGHSCIGELSAAISAARKTGLDMLLMSFEAYLRTINLPDAAGHRFWCLPMGDAEGNVEVWPYVEDVMKRENISFGDKPRCLETYEWLLENTKLRNYGECFGISINENCRDWGAGREKQNMDACLDLIKEREPKVYEQIMNRVEKGAVL